MFHFSQHCLSVLGRPCQPCKIDLTLKAACWAIAECLKLATADDSCHLSGIAPPNTKSEMHIKKMLNQKIDFLHLLLGQKSFLHVITTLTKSD